MAVLLPARDRSPGMRSPGSWAARQTPRAATSAPAMTALGSSSADLPLKESVILP